MQGCTIDDTLNHVLLLTRHIKNSDIQSAILAVLIELGFRPVSDGFGHLRKAIYLRYKDHDQRLTMLYLSVGKLYDTEVGIYQVEKTIRSAIDAAWKSRDDEEWHYFFPESIKKPTNGEFIARIACIMELWCSCCEEVCYGTK